MVGSTDISAKGQISNSDTRPCRLRIGYHLSVGIVHCGVIVHIFQIDVDLSGVHGQSNVHSLIPRRIREDAEEVRTCPVLANALTFNRLFKLEPASLSTISRF